MPSALSVMPLPSPRDKAMPSIGSIELSRPVASLGESVSRAMSAIYSVHVALNNSCKESSPQVAQFLAAKQDVRLQWESIAAFLQRSLGYARDYMPLCQSLQSGDPFQSKASASAVISYAHQIREDLSKVRQAYHLTVDNFKSNVGGLRIRGGFFASSSLDLKFDATPNSGSFVHATQSAIYPGMGSSSSAASKALDDSLTALNDISSFWDDHAITLAEMSSSSKIVRERINNGYFRSELGRWKQYHDGLLQAIFSISSSCDALMVTPIAQASHWRRRIGRFLQRRRGTMNDVDASRNEPSLPKSAIMEVPTRPSIPFALAHPFDVTGITRATIMTVICLGLFYTRSRSNPMSLKSRHLVFQRLTWQAQRYVQSLPNVENAALIGAEFARDAPQVIHTRDTQLAAVMHHRALEISDLLTRVINEYRGIEAELQQEVDQNPVKRLDGARIVAPPNLDRDSLSQYLSSLKDKELLAFTRTILGDLVQQLAEYQHFWSQLAIDLDAIRTQRLPWGTVSSDSSLFEKWAKLVDDLERYRLELQNGKTIDQAKVKSQTAFLRKPTLRTRSRSR